MHACFRFRWDDKKQQMWNGVKGYSDKKICCENKCKLWKSKMKLHFQSFVTTSFTLVLFIKIGGNYCKFDFMHLGSWWDIHQEGCNNTYAIIG